MSFIHNTQEIKDAIANGSFNLRGFINSQMSGDEEDMLSRVGADYAGDVITTTASKHGVDGREATDFMLRYALMRCVEKGDPLSFDMFASEAATKYKLLP